MSGCAYALTLNGLPPSPQPHSPPWPVHPVLDLSSLANGLFATPGALPGDELSPWSTVWAGYHRERGWRRPGATLGEYARPHAADYVLLYPVGPTGASIQTWMSIATTGVRWPTYAVVASGSAVGLRRGAVMNGAPIAGGGPAVHSQVVQANRGFGPEETAGIVVAAAMGLAELANALHADERRMAILALRALLTGGFGEDVAAACCGGSYPHDVACPRVLAAAVVPDEKLFARFYGELGEHRAIDVVHAVAGGAAQAGLFKKFVHLWGQTPGLGASHPNLIESLAAVDAKHSVRASPPHWRRLVFLASRARWGQARLLAELCAMSRQPELVLAAGGGASAEDLLLAAGIRAPGDLVADERMHRALRQVVVAWAATVRHTRLASATVDDVSECWRETSDWLAGSLDCLLGVGADAGVLRALAAAHVLAVNPGLSSPGLHAQVEMLRARRGWWDPLRGTAEYALGAVEARGGQAPPPIVAEPLGEWRVRGYIAEVRRGPSSGVLDHGFVDRVRAELVAPTDRLGASAGLAVNLMGAHAEAGCEFCRNEILALAAEICAHSGKQPPVRLSLSLAAELLSWPGGVRAAGEMLQAGAVLTAWQFIEEHYEPAVRDLKPSTGSLAVSLEDIVTTRRRIRTLADADPDEAPSRRYSPALVRAALTERDDELFLRRVFVAADVLPWERRGAWALIDASGAAGVEAALTRWRELPPGAQQLARGRRLGVEDTAPSIAEVLGDERASAEALEAALADLAGRVAASRVAGAALSRELVDLVRGAAERVADCVHSGSSNAPTFADLLFRLLSTTPLEWLWREERATATAIAASTERVVQDLPPGRASLVRALERHRSRLRAEADAAVDPAWGRPDSFTLGSTLAELSADLMAISERARVASTLEPLRDEARRRAGAARERPELTPANGTTESAERWVARVCVAEVEHLLAKAKWTSSDSPVVLADGLARAANALTSLDPGAAVHAEAAARALGFAPMDRVPRRVDDPALPVGALALALGEISYNARRYGGPSGSVAALAVDWEIEEDWEYLVVLEPMAGERFGAIEDVRRALPQSALPSQAQRGLQLLAELRLLARRASGTSNPRPLVQHGDGVARWSIPLKYIGSRSC